MSKTKMGFKIVPMVEGGDPTLEAVIIKAFKNNGYIKLEDLGKNEEVREEIRCSGIWEKVYGGDKDNGDLRLSIISAVVIRTLNAFIDKSSKWPDPFLPGYPLNPSLCRVHVILIKDTSKVVTWHPGLQGYEDYGAKEKERFTPHHLAEINARYIGIVNCFAEEDMEWQR